MKQRILVSAVLAVMAAASMPVPVHAQLFGESDEVKAARQKHEDDQDAQLARLPQLQAQIRDLSERVQNLTDSLARATGANETLSHQLGLLREQMDRQQKDFAYRLCMVSAQQLGADAGDQGLNCAAAGTAGAPRLSAPPPQAFAPGGALPPIGGDGDQAEGRGPRQEGAPVQLGRPPGILGTLPSGPPARFSTAPQAAPAGSGAQFDTAMNLLGRAQYSEASAAFRAYADANPDDQELSPKALYWVGQIAYLRQDYPTAARVFAEQIKKYPKSSRAPDSMLKLGQALIASGQTSGGCTALGAIKKQYPDASASTLAAAAGARKASCR